MALSRILVNLFVFFHLAFGMNSAGASHSACDENIPELEVVGHMGQWQNGGGLLDGCLHVYLDVGGNMGVQTRKLFEPRRYTSTRGARRSTCVSIQHQFNKYFGKEANKRQNQVCVLGFEPNPGHLPRLRQLAERYTSRGWRTAYVFGAAGFKNTTMVFTSDQTNVVEGGARLSGDCAEGTVPRGKAVGAVNVPVYDFAEFLKTHVIKREVPKGNGELPRVVAKVDIETAEYPLLGALLAKGEAKGEAKATGGKAGKRAVAKDAYWGVNQYMIEWHEMNATRAAVKERWDRASTSCEMDDESYRMDPYELPPLVKPPSDYSKNRDPWASMNVKRHGVFWRKPGFSATEYHAA